MACTPDTVTPKGVLINLNSGSDYTNCTVYTGLTDSTVTGTTNCINVTGTTCSLTGLSATLMEVFVKIDCEGCCSNTFRVNLDECCGYDEVLTPTPTPTYSQTITPTYSQTPTPTFTPSACECNTYRINFLANCGEFINWTDCDTNTPMSEQGDYFGLPGVTFTTGTVLDLCSCSLPTTDCTLVTISLVTTGCTIEGGFFITTPTPTPTPTPTLDSVPPLSVVIETQYRMNQSSGFTSFEIAAPNSSSAETVICQILNAVPSPQASGFSARYYSNPLGVGTRLYGFNSPYAPLNEIVGFDSDGIGILDGGLTYYLKTDVDGYITEYTLMTECQGKPWEIAECTDPCVGGICGCDGQTNTTVFTDSSVTSLTNPGVTVYADAQLLTPFDGFFSSAGTIYYVSSGTVTVECSGGSGC
jgi:hypothetical protein